MKKQTYQIVLTPESEGGFTVTVPALPGCISYGSTLEEAKLMIEDAISGYLSCLEERNELPDESLLSLQSSSFIALVTV
ncbi:hypothetical protein A2592_01530 [Candidatus Kaiserbacteria bacterium RIFOXYD1_FULL_42_15]|uniref:HicB-like antitoxin of toxin-antitoxin system domain-containing protein n=1 Tax=Candidatus Kaiserbacteria bacterium RIFOXYD1_FULL_42_15 TaxID=1798532 RepID=A0A1F6FPY5_9BACT|nr:MAG: hypothetical protein A2592_01530 [Candidatus Kaiserbacteria bacterium RIFOXYD1_FULL_42_15]